MELLQWSIVLIVALFGLVKSADFFTHGAENIGQYFGLSSFIVGATIVSVGSSMPEIATSIIGVVNGDPSFPISNVIGSNIANCLLVGGICAIAVGTLKVKQRLIDVDLPFFFMSTALFLLFCMDRQFTLLEGIICLLLLVIFTVYTIKDTDEDEPEAVVEKPKITFKELLFIGGGIIGIYFGANYTIQSVSEIALILSISPSIVTMIAVAIGTSLPELIVSVQAARAGKHSIALGNIFGSNTFNALAVTGLPVFFGTLTVSEDAWKIGIPFLIATSLGFIFVTQDDKIKKWEGYALLVLYIAFVGKLTGFV